MSLFPMAQLDAKAPPVPSFTTLTEQLCLALLCTLALFSSTDNLFLDLLGSEIYSQALSTEHLSAMFNLEMLFSKEPHPSA